MFVVYWLSGTLNEATPHAEHRRFDPTALADALQYAEALRRRQAQGEDIAFVTLCSENPQSVGKAGVADPPADYAWKKRRR
ncbi:hypothetical protein [Caballeronia sp. HLA56]